ncbi:hypothetical protein AJ85_08710 [Alkalihalobacillus alcalophilus ATCC 27647 = CGMCC 1.3604]|uniref:Regulatory protein YycH domain-containing protein n=1 Tax=Alkalihalobacillus alcalophilus ATCC 27647 = CGMCC 1.3604 TaxID=1218173 RepID=A0A094XC20_ALKAL|nr:two-component system activity regulator YycH [Alkalihalobacillus alcalophilus]KGA96335.1 hypothetical protein BALCAV_0216860 [Alkalihalobacillus alcalophilus ATCC 27647 = CGMCC 1.3604]MED1560743.1 two-component system activity regulator YycH [Alkalihalobacillus alcalophilus]THG90815.1 hypothetical protein AJ85_08710 [Alkalihalobacillus alcalophilus ATCC 27647 = CGMCC 1.3604]
MRYEQVKNWILIGLVALSLVLTWELWTFQPDFDSPDRDNLTTPDTLVGGRSLSIQDVIAAEALVVHDGDDYYMIPADSESYRDTYQRIFRSNIEVEMTPIGDPFPSEQGEQGLEVIFPTAIPTNVLMRLFINEEDEIMVPLTAVNRIYIYQNPNGANMFMQLFSEIDQDMVVLRSNLDYHMFSQNVFNQVEDFIPAVGVRELMDEQFKEQLYVPSEPYVGKKLSYTAPSIDIDFFHQLLFPVPSSISESRQANGERFYTDGSRILTTSSNEDFMDFDFRYPVISEDVTSRHIVDSSFDYINGHNGWTNSYYLSDWSLLTETEAKAKYRLQLENLPVIMYEGQDNLMNIQVSRVGGQTSRYIRPLFSIESLSFETNTVQLPSGPEMLEGLLEQEFFELDKVEKMLIGYEMESSSISYVTIEPHWFIKYEGSWKKLGDSDGERADTTGENRDELE